MSKADIPAHPITTGKANIVPMAVVAHTIAKGDPPEWLVLALANFQDFVGGEITSEEDRRYAQITEQMHEAAGKLITWLPAFMHMPSVIKAPDEVHTALEVLPKIKAYLARAMNQPPRKGGPRPNVERQVCAAIVVEAWTLIHGKTQPRSDWLYRACNDYWQACGHEYRSEGWRRDVEDAYERPKLTAVAHYQGSFADALDREIEKRANRPPPSKLIESRAVEVHPAEELKGPFARLRRRV